MIKTIMFSILYKSVIYKNGSLLLTSLAGSVTVQYLVTELMKNVTLKDILVPILISFFGVLLFLFFSLIDLITGLQAARYLSKTKIGYVKSHKLYRTLWKVLGVSLLIILFTGLSLIIKIAELDVFNFYKLSLCFLIVIILLASGFEFHSIGENIEKRTGKKPRMFNFFEIFLTKVQDGVIKRTVSLFKP